MFSIDPFVLNAKFNQINEEYSEIKHAEMPWKHVCTSLACNTTLLQELTVYATNEEGISGLTYRDAKELETSRLYLLYFFRFILHIIIIVGFEVLTVVSTKMAVFWVSVVLTVSIIRSMTSETSVNSYQSTRRYNPEDSHLHLTPCSS
jgi:hypothetical protein